MASFAARSASGAANGSCSVYPHIGERTHTAASHFHCQLQCPIEGCLRRVCNIIYYPCFPSEQCYVYIVIDVPHSFASEAESMRPVKMRSFAFDSPNSRVARWVPPAPGMIPNRASGNPILVTVAPMSSVILTRCLPHGMDTPATRRSHARLSSNPPPNAGPSTAAIVGTCRFSRTPSVARKSTRNLST